MRVRGASVAGFLGFFALLLALAPAFLSADVRNPQWAVPVDLPGAENFHKVSEKLYRAAQPNVEAFKSYEKFGIRTVVNLRNFHSDRDEMAKARVSLRLVDVPINTWSIDDDEVIAALVAIKSEEGPILLHCQHGADRTGTVVAMYRIVFEGWSKEAALDELQNGGYGYHSIWTNIPRYIKNVDTERIKRAVLASSGPR